MQSKVFSQGFEYGVKHFLSTKDDELINILVETLETDHQINRNQLLFLIDLGCVYVNSQRITSQSAKVSQNDHIRVHTKPRRYQIDHPWKDRIVANYQDFIILNKPGGIPSHPSVDNRIENSLTQSALALGEDLFVTHRLDTLTEGLIVYGKNSRFVHAFNIQLKEKTATKKYVALVENNQKLPNHLIHFMEKTPRAPKTVSTIFHEGWDMCELKIEKQKVFNLFSHIKIDLLTGRTHQIRSQLADIGAPIVGDTLYGSKTRLEHPGIMLRAQEIQFNWNGQRHLFEIDDQFMDQFMISD